MRVFIFYTIIVFCSLNLARMAVYIFSSDVYNLHRASIARRKKRPYRPTVSIVVPAYNEENTIGRALMSLYETTYPAHLFEVVVANDGSSDNTKVIVEQFKKTHRNGPRIVLVNRPNRGKAAALNHAMQHMTTGKLIMCLDADSRLAPDALTNAVEHFRDRNVVTLSSNVNIIEDGTLLALIQRFEYLICYQMKKGQALMGIEYIVGGIGSMFRSNILRRVSFYDTNTMTEDIDLTMKILASKSRKQRIAYAADSVVYTEAAHTMKELRNQRFRWKYGRSQTFVKNSGMFFSRHERHAKRLTWVALPLALLQDLIFLAEPVVIAWFVYISYQYGDWTVFRNALIVITAYILYNVWASDHITFVEKMRLTYFAPAMYILMYALSIAEYFALVKSLMLSPKLVASLNNQHTTWKSPTRRKNIA